ncbi:hypothetical protein [Halomicrococcus sp. NG-SE-24]|uniref:hypothetical protein n=1 Tax=Halomicrococcus sp. NG-SE-24 TaxID=3436928 RepID=UPI003D9704D8
MRADLGRALPDPRLTAVLRGSLADLWRYAKHLLAHSIYVGTSVAVVAPVVVGTGATLIWFGSTTLPPTP